MIKSVIFCTTEPLISTSCHHGFYIDKHHYKTSLKWHIFALVLFSQQPRQPYWPFNWP